ncbi:MAG: hypothetical protein Q4A74_02810 [Cardiobacteriaceae bacterium]|nr:hypothetical protein [Cardiobacteriaceae bacterium]
MKLIAGVDEAGRGALVGNVVGVCTFQTQCEVVFARIVARLPHDVSAHAAAAIKTRFAL